MIGIICAMQVEADGMIALCENTRTTEKYGMRFTRGTLNGQELVIVVCGVGKVNAAMCATVLINDFQPSLVINSGVAGALSPVVSVGDIVVGTKTVEHDMNVVALGDKQGEVSFPDGKVLYFDCDKDASVMEGAAIGHVCYCCKVPFAVLRAISDDLDENKGMDFIKFCSLAAEKTVFAIDGFTKSI